MRTPPFFTLILFFLLGLVFGVKSLKGQEIAPLDFRDISLETEPVTLIGPWDFYWQTLLSDSTEVTPPIQLLLPGNWYDTEEMHLQALGYGSYRQSVLLPTNKKDLGLYISHVFSSYLLIVNGEVLYESGRVGKTKETYKPYREPKVIPLPELASDTMHIVIEASNFDHYNAGMLYAIELGNYDFLQRRLERIQAVNLFLAGGFFITGFILLVFSMAYRQLNIQVTFYALFSLSLMYRMLGAFPFPLHRIMNDYSFQWATRIEYFSILTAVMFGGLFIFTLYPRQTNVWVKRIFLAINLLYGSTVLFASPLHYTDLMQYFVLFILLYLLVFIYIIIRARVEKELSSSYLIFALVMVLFYTFIQTLSFFGMYTFPNWVTVLTISLIIVSCNVALFRSFMQKIKQTEKAISEASLEQSRQTMLSLISHEIKTPVATLQMNLDMLSEVHKKEVETHPLKQKILSTSLSAINDIKAMLNDFMYFMAAKAQPEDLLSAEDFSIFLNQKFDLTVHLDLKNPQKNYYTSQVTLHYVFKTLVSNANKFSAKGTQPPEFHLLQKDDELIIELRDFGEGMTEAQIEKLGDLNLNINKKQDVSGIGFYLARQLTQRLDHQMFVEARKEGTSVFINLKEND